MLAKAPSTAPIMLIFATRSILRNPWIILDWPDETTVNRIEMPISAIGAVYSYELNENLEKLLAPIRVMKSPKKPVNHTMVRIVFAVVAMRRSFPDAIA